MEVKSISLALPQILHRYQEDTLKCAPRSKPIDFIIADIAGVITLVGGVFALNYIAPLFPTAVTFVSVFYLPFVFFGSIYVIVDIVQSISARVFRFHH